MAVEPKRRDTWVIAQQLLTAIRSVSTMFECGFGGDEGEICHTPDYYRLIDYVSEQLHASQVENMAGVCNLLMVRGGKAPRWHTKYREAMLTISTAHLPEPYPDFGSFRAIHHEHGVIVPLCEAGTIPAWFRPLAHYGSEHDVQYINFDADAPEHPSFDTYWEDDDHDTEE